jgi:predicted membrane-bound spermidine synthase
MPNQYPQPQSKRRLLILIFALSGFSGLIYESVWAQYVKLFLGHAAYAQTLVLAIFMGGLALGSWLAARVCARLPNLLLAYAVAEGLVGICALAFHGLFTAAMEFSYDSVLPALSGGVAQTYKWLLCALFLLPPSVLLGTTFPFMTGGILRLYPQAPGTSVARLYFVNSLGAALGVLASAFALIAWLGLPGTMLTAGLVNVALALLVWGLAKDRAAAPAPAAAPGTATADGGALLVKLLLAAAFVTGLASFLYEIAWIRLLSLVLGASTHSFELMLSAFILGLALGGAWISRRIDRIEDPKAFLGYVQLAMGVLALATIPLSGLAFDAMQSLLQAVSRSDSAYVVYNFASHLLCLFIMLPATFCAGMTLPLMTFVLLRGRLGERALGLVYASNTVGSIAGVLLAVHVVMPWLGLKGVIGLGAAFDIAAGVALLLLGAVQLRSRPVWVATGAALACLVLVAGFVQLDAHKLASGVFRRGEASLPRDVELLYRRDGKTASVGLIRWPNGLVAVNTNGKTDAAINLAAGAPHPDESTMVLLGALALALNPQARNAANIGMGSGLTTHVLLGSQRVERVDTIEIEAFMVEAARGFHPRNRRAFEDPRSRIHIEDAKSFFSTRGQRYDIIVSEPSNPWVSGVASLFSSEFYARIARQLQPDGVFVQWVQLYEIDVALVASIMRALSPHFSDYAVYTTNDLDLLIAANNRGRLGEPDAGLLATPEVAAELRRVGISGALELQAHRIGTKAMLEPMFRSFGVPANSDYFPYLDQNAARSRFKGDRGDALSRLPLHPVPIVEMLGEPPHARGAEASGFEAEIDAASGKIRSVAYARQLRDAILSDRHDLLPPQVSGRMLLVPALLNDCGLVQAPGVWGAALLDLAGALVPHLTAAELDAVWDKLETMPCARRIAADDRALLELVRAVSQREAARMARLAAELLARPGLQPGSERVRYAVSAGLLGHLTRGDRLAAEAFLQDHRSLLSLGEGMPVELRLLVSLTRSEAVAAHP